MARLTGPVKDTMKRLESCWNEDIDWSVFVATNKRACGTCYGDREEELLSKCWLAIAKIRGYS